jgi:hypothetical protein
LPGAAPSWGDEPTQREIALLANEKTVKIGVGLLPYVSIASEWQKRRPVVTDLAAYRHRLHIDTTFCRMVALGELTSSHNAIPRSNYLFGPSWPHVRRTLLVAMEQDGDPYAVMVPTAEIIRFYYGPSTRLAQALFWGEYDGMFNADRSGGSVWQCGSRCVSQKSQECRAGYYLGAWARTPWHSSW